MNKQTRETIVQFLQRTELKGYEVPAFNQVMQELLEEEPEEMLKDKEEIQDEDQEDQDQEPEEDEEDKHYWLQRGYEAISDADG